MPQATYDGFISYSRQDIALARRLGSRLESLKAPLGATRGALRIFLDAEELSANARPSDSRRALEASAFLVVLASPRSVESELVRREVRTWVESKGWTRVLFVLAAGEPTLVQAFSNPESDTIYEGPVAADLRARTIQESLRLVDDEALRIAARLMGVEFEALRQPTIRERSAKQRRLIAFLSAGLAVTTMALGFATWQWRVAVALQQTAEQRLSGVNQSADAQSPQAQWLGHLRQATLASQALDVVAAERELSAAERLSQQLPAADRPRAETLLSHARCELAWSRQAYADTLSCSDRAERLGRSWAASGSSESRHQLAAIMSLRGDARAHLRNWSAASGDYHEADSLIEQLRREGPDTAELTLAAAAVQQRLARVEEVARSAEGVTERLVKSTHLLDRVDQKQLSTQGMLQLLEIYQRLAELCARSQRGELAKSLNAKAYDLADALYVSNPQHARYQLALAAAKHARGKGAFAEGRFLRATLDFAGESELLEILLKKARANMHAWRDYLGARAMLIDALAANNNLPEASEEFARLDSAVRDFVNARTNAPTDEAFAVAIRGFSQVADAARQLDRPKALVEASEESLQLAKQRYARSPDLGDARLDLFIAHANMTLAAAATNDTRAMEAHAREARRLMPAAENIEPDEQELVGAIQKLLVQVLGPVASK